MLPDIETRAPLRMSLPDIAAAADVTRTLDAQQARVKPLLRGWSHAVAAVASLALTATFLARSWSDPPRLLSLLVFGLCMTELYTVSAVFHIGRWQPPRFRLLQAMDHASIFLAIAGTYTPFCFIVLDGWPRVALLALVWALAVLGISLKIGMSRMSRGLSTGLYVAMGWVAVLALPAFWAALPGAALALLALGGALYTTGAVVFGWRWPDPFPRYFGFHEVFHLLVIAGFAAITLALWGWVLPLP